jgi:hypothetical protein
MKTKFYTYGQNNSGGSFEISPKEGISIFVIIEAESSEKANEIAEEKGLYFNGCEEGLDCDCCGDRWSRADESDGYEKPCIYGAPIEEYKSNYSDQDCYVHYLSGDIKHVEFLTS